MTTSLDALFIPLPTGDDLSVIFHTGHLVGQVFMKIPDESCGKASTDDFAFEALDAFIKGAWERVDEGFDHDEWRAISVSHTSHWESMFVEDFDEGNLIVAKFGNGGLSVVFMISLRSAE